MMSLQKIIEKQWEHVDFRATTQNILCSKGSDESYPKM